MHSSLARKASVCGRPIEKPQEVAASQMLNLMEEAVPVHQQIENLRTKITLKDRYNKALKEQIEETREGANSELKVLYKETICLRQDLVEAIAKERHAVQNALRTHHKFQLALRAENPEGSIAWLDDKIFDCAKELNLIISELVEKRKKLQNAELNVLEIEKWPKPGCFPWEVEMTKKISKNQVAIAAAEVRLETARILHQKYQEIKSKLREEEEKYAPVIHNLESQLKYQTSEHRALQLMLEDAEYFQSEAEYNEKLTEKEAYDNRKQRRIQLLRSKRAVERILLHNLNSTMDTHDHNQAAKILGSIMHTNNSNNLPSVPSINPKTLEFIHHSHAIMIQRMHKKKIEIEQLESWIARLVDLMHVPDLTHIPSRIQEEMILDKKLNEEKTAKEFYRLVIINQRNDLLNLLHHLRYSGREEEIRYQKVISDYDATIVSLERQITEAQTELKYLGDKLTKLHLGLLNVLLRLDENARKNYNVKNSDKLVSIFPVILHKIQILVNSVKELKALFRDKKAEKDYIGGIKPELANRFHRVKTPEDSEGSDGLDDDDIGNFSVPTREELKAKSYTLIKQARLKRGIE